MTPLEPVTKPVEERIAFYRRLERHAFEVLLVVALVAGAIAGLALKALTDVQTGQRDATVLLEAVQASERRGDCSRALIGQELGYIVAGLQTPTTQDADGNGILDRVEDFTKAQKLAEHLQDIEKFCP